MTMPVMQRGQRVTQMLMGAAALLVLGACGGDQLASGDRLPWRTVADSTGDTIRVVTTGSVPDSLVRSVVPVVQVGALDGPEELTFGFIGDVLALADGGLLVHDTQSELVRMYDSTGTFVRTLGAKGGGPGEYGQINGIARHPGGDLFLWDASGGRINHYRADGQFVGSWRSPFTGWFTQNQLFADTSGRLLTWMPIIADPNQPLDRRDSFVRLDTAGTILDTLLSPRFEGDAEPLKASSPNGRSQTMTTRPWSPNAAVSVHPAGGIVAGLGREYLFYRLPEQGKPIRIEMEQQPVPVSDTERRERQAQIEQTMRRLDPNWNWTGAPIPATKPAYERFLIGEDGRIWVRISTPSEPIPADELPTPRVAPNAPPPVILTTREPVVFDVFEADGRYLGRVRVPSRARLLRVRGNTAWGTQRDEDDVQYAVRFRVEPALP